MRYDDEPLPKYPSLSGKGLVFLVSGPSGVGKSTVVKRLLETIPELVKVVTTTSRPRRSGEEDGVHYHFVSRETFVKMIDRQQLVEWKHHFGAYYGLTRDALRGGSNQDLILDVDTEGKKDIVAQLPERVITIFMRAPSLDEARNRLAARGGLSEEELRQRLDKAQEELQSAQEYDYTVENADVERTVEYMRSIIADERLRRDAEELESGQPGGSCPGRAERGLDI